MLLDELNLLDFTMQIEYPLAFRIWDNAGEVAHLLSNIWGELEIEQASPADQVLKNPSARLVNGLRTSYVTVANAKTLDANIQDRLVSTFAVWERCLGLTSLKRISARARYVKNYRSIADANRRAIDLGICRMPAERVFDQNPDSPRNSINTTLRFEDDNSFSAVTIRTETTKLEIGSLPEFDRERVFDERHRFILEFDRGSLGEIPVAKIRVNEWLKGYMHVLRRDIDKVVGNA